MDKYFGNVCELDLIFSFAKGYFILDELLLAGELQESSKKNILRVISAQDSIEDTEVSSKSHARSFDFCAFLRLVQTPSDPCCDVFHASRLKPPFYTNTHSFPGRRGGYEDHVNHGFICIQSSKHGQEFGVYICNGFLFDAPIILKVFANAPVIIRRLMCSRNNWRNQE